jgi:hypothetical protein
LIRVVKPSRIRHMSNVWTAGQPLENGTTLATFMVRNPEEGILRVRSDAQIGFAVGKLDVGRTQFATMIERVRYIVDGAVTLVDQGA